MRKLKTCVKAILATAACVTGGAPLFAAEIDATTYAWKANERPASAYGGKVTFGYDADGRLTKLTVVEFPDVTSKKLTFTGDAMTFANGESFVYLAPGEVVFDTSVTADTFYCYGNDVETKAMFTYGHGDTFLTETPRLVFPGANLDDWDIDTAATVMSATDVSSTAGWKNPDNTMYARAIRREPGKVSFQYQTTPSSYEGKYLTKVVRVELTQNADGILAKALAPTHYLLAATTADLATYKPFDEYADDPAVTVVKSGGPFVPGGGGYGVNIMKFVRTVPIYTVRFTASEGTRGVNLLSPQAFVDVVLDEASTMKANGNVWPRKHGRLSLRDGSLDWTGSPKGGDGGISFETTKEGTSKSVAPADYGKGEYWFVANNALTKVAENCRLTDLVVATNRAWVIWSDGTMPSGTSDAKGGSLLKADENCSWCNLSGTNLGGTSPDTNAKNSIHPANLFNLKFRQKDAVTNATVQAQCQHGNLLRCVYLNLCQIGDDVYAGVDKYVANYAYVTNANIVAKYGYGKLLGVDFDEIKDKGGSWSVTANKTTAQSCTEGVFGIRNLHLKFRPSSHVITATKPCRIAGGNYEIGGTGESRMILNVSDFGGLPTNGTVTVKAGGELWLSPVSSSGISAGMSGGTCAVRVEKGGLVRQLGNYVFGTSQKVELDGGKIDFADAWDRTTAYACTYVFSMDLRNGAEVFSARNRSVRMGAAGAERTFAWTVGGTSPSTNRVVITPLSSTSGSWINRWVLDVADTGDWEADYVQDADVVSYSDTDAGVAQECCRRFEVIKKGAGTMLMNGAYAHYGPLRVQDGKLIFGKSDLWKRDAAMEISGGATVETADGTSNTAMGTLTVGTDGGAIRLGEGSALAFADSQGCAWSGTLNVSMPTNAAGKATATLKFDGGLADAQIGRVRINGKRAIQDEDGNLSRYDLGLAIVIR